MTIKPENFTRVRNDVNGNPRYVLHFLNLNMDADTMDISGKYAVALKRAKNLGGRKFHNKQYGGGIVFQSYSLPGLCQDLNSLFDNLSTNPQFSQDDSHIEGGQDVR